MYVVKCVITDSLKYSPSEKWAYSDESENLLFYPSDSERRAVSPNPTPGNVMVHADDYLEESRQET